IGGARIVMRGLVAHMSVDHFAGGVTEYISFMRLHHRRSLYFIDDHAQAYQLFTSSSVFPATAKGANSFFQGFETDAYDVLNLSIAQMRTQKLLSAYALNQAGLQPGPETLLSHTVVDLLFSNATYDNDSAQFRSYHGHAPYLDKIDPAQELVAAMQDDVKQILK
ncbi:MAG: hypothetical protein ABIV43_03635, partial [Candidatus Saccharimonadales bacterium]